jgi:hypothetical protein
MNKSRVRVGQLLFAIALASGLILLGHVLAGHRELVRSHELFLLNVRKAWILDGSPTKPQVSSYTTPTNSYYALFVHTNQYLAKGERIESIFAIEDKGFEGKGFLVISPRGHVLWIDRKNGPRMIRKAGAK